MSHLDDTTKLDNYEDEDIFDVVVKLEKSFGLKLEKDAFHNVKTFGDMCDVFEKYMNYHHREDCTKQQAFYRVRNAVGTTQKINVDQIKLNSKLNDLFPVITEDKRQKNLKVI